jgi:tyrosyl-DNA phosphodiesterase-1
MILGVFEDNKPFFGAASPAKKARADPYDSDEPEVQIVSTPSGSKGKSSSKSAAPREKFAGWLYVGSHNMTPSAWGTISGSSFQPILNITNYELGVVFPIKEAKMMDELAAWKRPARKYVLGQDLPWVSTAPRRAQRL